MKTRTSIPVKISCLFLGLAALSTCKNKPAQTADPRENKRVIDTAALSYLMAADKQSAHAVFVCTKNFPELKRLKNKVIVIKPLNQELKINDEEYVHKDFMGPIYILLPSYYTGIRAAMILKCFPAYKGFTLKDLSQNYVVYYTARKR